MARIETYNFDTNLSLDDFVIGSDADNINVTRNYKLSGVFSTFKSSLDLASIEYTFSDGTDPDLDETDEGYFTTNSNQTSAPAVVTININGIDGQGQDISSLVSVVSAQPSSFVLRLYKPSATGQVFYFAINSITSTATGFSLDVSNFVGSNDLVDATTYSLVFDLAGVPSIYSETDPVFTASDAASITASQISNWDEAYSWGDHSLEGYLVSADIAGLIGLSDLSVTQNSASGNGTLTYSNVTGVFTYTPPDLSSYITSESDPIFTASAASGITTVNINQWNEAYGWGDHSLEGYITSESDPVFSASEAATITSTDTTNWNAAYSWGDHASIGYLLQTDIDTLAELNTIVTDATLIDSATIDTLNEFNAFITDGDFVDTVNNQYTIGGEKTFTGAVQLFDGRVGVQTPVFGGSRLGDSGFQTPTIDLQSINFKDSSQLTALAMFFSAVGGSDGYVTTMKNFVDDVNVISIAGLGTATAFGEASREVESTIGLRNDFSGGEFYVLDMFNNDYDAATEVATGMGWVAIHGGGATAKEVGLWRYDTTTYTPIWELSSSNVWNFGSAVTVQIDGNDVLTSADGNFADFVDISSTQTITGQKTFTASDGDAVYIEGAAPSIGFTDTAGTTTDNWWILNDGGALSFRGNNDRTTVIARIENDGTFYSTNFQASSRLQGVGDIIAGSSELTSSSANLQVNGFQRTGNIYLHSGGNTPTLTRSADYLSNTDSGTLQWTRDGIGTSTIWHEGNDGASSGLDADLLDGDEGSTYIQNYPQLNTTTGYFESNGGVQGDIGYQLASGNNYGGSLPNTFMGLWVFMGDGDQRTFVLAKQNESYNYWLGTVDSDSPLSVTYHKIWTEGSQGSGTGMDADTVDSLEASQFLRSDTSDSMTGSLTVSGNVTSGSSTSSSFTQMGVTRMDISTADYGEIYFAMDANDQSGYITNQVNDSTAANELFTINFGGSNATDPQWGVYNGSSYDYYDFITEKTTSANFYNFPSTSNISFNFDNAAISDQGATFRYEYSDSNMLTGTGFGFQILGHNGSTAPRLEVEGAIYSGSSITAVNRLSSAGLDIIDSGTAIDVQTSASQWALRTDTNGANFSGVFFSSGGSGYLLSRTSSGNLGVDLRPFETSKLYGNILEIYGASPRVRFLEQSSSAEADVFDTGENTADWTALVDSGNFDIREDNVTNTRFRISSGGEINAYNNVLINSGGNLQFVSSGSILNHHSSASRDKIRVWNSSFYTIGMDSGYTYGGLNSDFAMTFQMNNDNDRGWWWGDDQHTDAQGAMALTTEGRLTVAEYMRLGYGQTDTTSPGTTYRLQVNGDIEADDFVLSSDERYKDKIEDVEVKGIDARWRTYVMKDSPDVMRHGVIAQELEEFHPEFVVTGEDGYKGVRYTDLLVAKMAEKDKQIESLEKRVQRLEGLIMNIVPSMN